MRNTISTALLVALSSAACAETGTEHVPTACEEASARVAACVGAEVETPFGESCTDDEARSARGLLAEMDANGCDGSAGGKADGFFCGIWDPLRWCDDPAAPLGPVPAGTPTRHPILLAHGFNTSTTNFWRFNDVDVALREDGHTVVLGSVPPFDTPEVRAAHLAEQVDEMIADGAERVNLVCFSQGGIDCRYLISPGGLGYGDRVATLTTISSPHRGSHVADVVSALLPDGERASGRVVDLVAGWYGQTFSELAGDSHFIAAMESMSEPWMAEFNRRVPDDSGVYYQSYAGFSYVAGLANPRDTLEEVCRDEHGSLQILGHEGKRDVMDPLLVASALLVAHGAELRPNDGVSTVESAHWGVFRGCIPADHLDQVGQIRDRGSDRRTGFDYLRFYRNLAFDLAELGY